tara:strand:+ start:2206 stop:2526 length:321 start_codon:yes stop_codon:yes gene_type:complete
MTKEQKEELVKMDWREVIKSETRKKPQTRIAGGNPQDTGKGRRRGSIMDMDEDRKERQELVNATREDLIDKIMDVIGSYSDEQLMELLLGTQGNIEVGAIQFRDNR